MLALLIRFSIRYHGLIILLAALILAYGGYRFSTTGLDIFPEFAPKRVIIQTESPGFSTEQVENFITKPIEMSVNGLPDLITVRSESIQGLSIITATFADSSDHFRNRQVVNERLQSLSNQLPVGIIPLTLPLTSSSSTVMTLGLQSDTLNLMDLRSVVDTIITPHLLAVAGVADINVFGGELKQLQIQLNPVLLKKFNLSIQEVIAASRQALMQQGSGFIENDNQRFSLSVSGYALTPEAFSNTLIPLPVTTTEPPRNISLSELAEIKFASQPRIGAAQINGKEGIVLMVIGQFGANTLTVSTHIDAALHSLATLLNTQDIHFYPHLFRPADYIERSWQSLSKHLLMGCVCVVLILYLFLYNLRVALIAALAIPISLVTAVVVLLETGVHLNIMVLGGLAIALGEVVDDAIIDTENIYRRLQEHQITPNFTTLNEVIYHASLEVRSSVVYASFIVALVFVPLLSLEGVAGRLFAPLGYAYILAILASLIVALTLTPALCVLLFKHLPTQSGSSPLLQRIQPCYLATLNVCHQHFRLVVLTVLGLCVMGGSVLTHLKSEFLPELREGHYIIHTTSLPGTSLTESLRLGRQLTKAFLAIAEVESVSQWAGRAERGADTYGSHYSEYEVRLQPLSGAQQKQRLQQLRTILHSFPGIAFEANTFLTERIDETIAGYTAPVVINIYGDDLNVLDEQAQKIATLTQQIKGASNVQVRSVAEAPQITIALNPIQMQLYGVAPAQVNEVIHSAYEALPIGKVFAGTQRYPVTVTLTPEWSSTLDAIGELPLKTQAGRLISLKDLADIQLRTSRYNILHQNTQRKQTITSHIINRDVDDFMAEIKQTLHDQHLPNAPTYLEFTGAAIEQARARTALIIHALIATLGVLVLIYIALGSFRHTLLTLANLPFALLGGIIAVVITHASLSVGSVVGFITLFGITVRNSIMLISHYRHLVCQQQLPWTLTTAYLGAQERLPSILMTALVTGLAMFPIAFNSDNPGQEIMGPMATIIIGGLFTSTVLNLLVMPLLLVRYGKFDA